MPCMELLPTKRRSTGRYWRYAVAYCGQAAVQQLGPVFAPGDIFVGMEGFGASAPADQLFQHFIRLTPLSPRRKQIKTNI